MFDCVTRFFFFKQKTAYELRISDWSSDVCSSDLAPDRAFHRLAVHRDFAAGGVEQAGHQLHQRRLAATRGSDDGDELARSEERRVGKECVSTCRTWWSPYQSKKK